MKREDVFKKLDSMLENPKSKNFINHLAKSHLPSSKVTKVLDKPKGNFKCVITNKKLVSVNEVLSLTQTEEFKVKFMENLKNWDKPEQQNTINEMVGNKVLAFQGEKTDTFMSAEGFNMFFDWFATKLLKGDKHINWLSRTINKNYLMGRMEGVANDAESIEKLDRMKSNSKVKRATMKLGDLSALQELKKKMDK